MMGEKGHDLEQACVVSFQGAYRFLSNFYPSKLVYEGVAYRNAEAAFQAQKCADAKDREQFSELRPDEAKRLGRHVTLRSHWDTLRVGVMERVVQAKFAQNPRLAKRLLATGDEPLYEGNSWHDTFWGVDGKTRQGENHLGRILMALRESIREQGLPNDSAQRPVQTCGPIQGIVVTDEALVDVQAACLVNATDNRLTAASSLCGELYWEAGPAFQKQCLTLGWCETGGALLTEGYDLAAQHVIHTAEPLYQRDGQVLLAQCYRGCLDLAREAGIHSIAFPPIGTGQGSFPWETAARVAIEAMLGWVEENPEDTMEIILACEEAAIFKAASDFLRQKGKPKATPDDWNTDPMEEPVKRVLLHGLTLTAGEYARLSQGLIPEEMEDKWFLCHQEDRLSCYRSWTGQCAYIVQFERVEEGYRAASFLAPEKVAEDRRASAVVGALVSFLAGNRAAQERYTLQYQVLSGVPGRDAATGLLLYTTFGLQVLAGLRGADAETSAADSASAEAASEKVICREEAIRSGLFGLCVADALGVPAEFRSRESLAETPMTGMTGGGAHNQPTGTWSDDSSMTLCLADSLGRTGGVHTHDIMNRFVSWWRKGDYTAGGRCFDIGHTTAQALQRYQNGTTPALCGGNKDRDNGNGSLMRILPLAYELYAAYGAHIGTTTRAMDKIHKVSGLTHRHPVAQSACGIYVCIAAQLLERRWEAGVVRRMGALGGSDVPYRRNYEERIRLNAALQEGVQEALAWYDAHERFEGISDRWERLKDLRQLRDTPRSKIRSGGYVVDTLEAALWCLLNTDSYEACVLEAVNLGRDTDTTAAVAGGLAGLAYGYDAIPAAWLSALQGRQVIEACCVSLAGRFPKREIYDEIIMNNARERKRG